jgi:phosphoglycerate dehydrogenase-like enzyme
MASVSDIPVLITVPFPEPLVERLRTISPRLQIQVHSGRKAQDLPADLLPDTEVLYTLSAIPEPEAVPSLRWIQFHLSGVDMVADQPIVRTGVKITTMSGASAPQMAEFVLMGILALGHRLTRMQRDKVEKHWAEDRFERFRPVELRGSTVGIFGYGSVGREVARLCRAFGASILAVKRDLRRPEDEGFSQTGLGDPGAELVERLYPPQALGSMAAGCDYLVVSVPLTPETRGAIDRTVFRSMNPGAFLIDISRGGVVDHAALVEALNEKRLGGALLDVYPVEPLPETSPLWEMSNVILSPHVAGASGLYYERAADLFAENLKRYLSDQPLLNLFDPQRGY